MSVLAHRLLRAHSGGLLLASLFPAAGCARDCEPFSDSGAEAYGGGTATIALSAKAEDGVEASGTDTGASPEEFQEAFFLPDDDSWAYFDSRWLYVEVCTVVVASGCAEANACFRSDYLPVDWVDGAAHDISGESGLQLRGEADAVDFSTATIVMPERWTGSATFGPFTWEDLGGSCLTNLGSTSALVTWDFRPEVAHTWDPQTSCVTAR